MLAEAYLSIASVPVETPCRFDVVSIWAAPNTPPIVQLIRDAFSPA
jgi:hypothetical protein